jgi:uncharacterized protein YukE
MLKTEVPTPQTLSGLAGDVRAFADSIDATLSRLLELTADSLRRWEADGEGESRFDDEFAVPASEVAQLAVEWRDAHIARLIANVALLWGTPPGEGWANSSSLGSLIRKDYGLTEQRDET